jgi:hypothetical protein
VDLKEVAERLKDIYAFRGDTQRVGVLLWRLIKDLKRKKGKMAQKTR